MASDTPLTLSHSSNAGLVVVFTQPQPGRREKVLVGSSGTTAPWILGGNPGDNARPLRPNANNTRLYVDSSNSLWVEVGDHSETRWWLSDQIPNTESGGGTHTHAISDGRQYWVLNEASAGTQVTVAPSSTRSITFTTEDTADSEWSCNNGCWITAV